MVANLDIRRRARGAGVPLWQLAKSLGISEPTLTRRLRIELNPDDKTTYFQHIEQLAGDYDYAQNENRES